MRDPNRSPYDIQKGDLVEVISRSLKRREGLKGIGFVLAADQEKLIYKIYWRDQKVVRNWEFGPGYLKRLSKA